MIFWLQPSRARMLQRQGTSSNTKTVANIRPNEINTDIGKKNWVWRLVWNSNGARLSLYTAPNRRNDEPCYTAAMPRSPRINLPDEVYHVTFRSVK